MCISSVAGFSPYSSQQTTGDQQAQMGYFNLPRFLRSSAIPALYMKLRAGQNNMSRRFEHTQIVAFRSLHMQVRLLTCAAYCRALACAALHLHCLNCQIHS